MPAKEPDDDEVRRLIRESVQIVRDDRERAHYKELHGKYGEQPESGSDEKEAGEGDPPPATEVKEEPKPEYGLWGKKKPR